MPVARVTARPSVAEQYDNLLRLHHSFLLPWNLEYEEFGCQKLMTTLRRLEKEKTTPFN